MSLSDVEDGERRAEFGGGRGARASEAKHAVKFCRG